MIRGRLVAALLTCVGGLVLTGCATLPVDPGRTLDGIRASEILRAGASPHEPHVVVDGLDVAPSGPEPTLVEAFAASLGARVTWVVSGEEDLMQQLEDGEVDLVVGGLTDASPWVDRVALTRPYAESVDDRGMPQKHVIAAPMGENAFLVELERFLEQSGAS